MAIAVGQERAERRFYRRRKRLKSPSSSSHHASVPDLNEQHPQFLFSGIFKVLDLISCRGLAFQSDGVRTFDVSVKKTDIVFRAINWQEPC